MGAGCSSSADVETRKYKVAARASEHRLHSSSSTTEDDAEKPHHDHHIHHHKSSGGSSRRQQNPHAGGGSSSRSSTLDNYGHLCRSTASRILNHEQLSAFAALATLTTYAPKQKIYQAGAPMDEESVALYFVVEGSCNVSKWVEFSGMSKLGHGGHGGGAHGVGAAGAGTGAELSMPHAPGGSKILQIGGNGLAPSQFQQRREASGTGNGGVVVSTNTTARWTNTFDKTAESSFEVRLRSIESNQWFGYCTMLGMSVRQSTVTAAEHTLCLTWDEEAINEFFGRFPGTSSLLRDGIAGHRVMRELSNASFLTNLQEDHAALLCTLFQSRFIPSNTVIFEEGEVSSENSSLFVLVSGSAVMYQAVPGGGQNLVKAIEPGDFFGEACMLFRLPRIGTVRTNHASVVMELSFASFTSFLRYTPNLGVDVKRAFNNNSIAMVYLMQNPVIHAAFTEFCCTEHSTENIDFFEAAKAFRLSALRQKALITLDARNIYDKFIAASAEHQVNLFSATRERVASALEHNIINKLTFEEAEEEVLHLMDRDSFTRFKQSGLFQDALQRCRDKA